ncbi:putative DsbA family dithiol-disulfide isomerase [Bacillus mesophilus]|nr:putative DsbA family dithiol-disulfide isomerase [Bacillus mesophilus]
MYRCFELDPNAARDNKQNIYEKLAEKYGMSIEQAKSNTQNMVEMAKAEGLDYKMDTLILTNTFDAHRLTMFAKSKGLMHEMTNRILHAFYTESKHIGDHETLIELAVEVGLNREEVAELLAGNQMSSEVRADEENAGRYGIRSIPTFIINEKYALTGAQSADVMAQALQQVLDQDGSYKK